MRIASLPSFLRRCQSRESTSYYLWRSKFQSRPAGLLSLLVHPKVDLRTPKGTSIYIYAYGIMVQVHTCCIEPSTSHTISLWSLACMQHGNMARSVWDYGLLAAECSKLTPTSWKKRPLVHSYLLEGAACMHYCRMHGMECTAAPGGVLCYSDLHMSSTKKMRHVLGLPFCPFIHGTHHPAGPAYDPCIGAAVCILLGPGCKACITIFPVHSFCR